MLHLLLFIVAQTTQPVSWVPQLDPFFISATAVSGVAWLVMGWTKPYIAYSKLGSLPMSLFLLLYSILGTLIAVYVTRTMQGSIFGLVISVVIQAFTPLLAHTAGTGMNPIAILLQSVKNAVAADAAAHSSVLLTKAEDKAEAASRKE
jgi:hypothetical protein